MPPAGQTALTLAYQEAVLRLASQAYDMGGPPTVEDLELVGQVENLLKVVELALVAGLVESGVSWQAMAKARRGTSRQALNYRLSRQTLRWRATLMPNTAELQKQILDDNYSEIQALVAALSRRSSVLEEATRGSLQEFQTWLTRSRRL